MARKATLVLFALCAAFLLGAQEAPRKVLSDRDVDAFIANAHGIEADLDALGDRYDQSYALGALASGGTSSPSSFLEYRNVKVPAEVEAVMKKHGLGDGGFEKYLVIAIGFGALFMEQTMAVQLQAYADMPEMQAAMTEARAAAGAMKAAVHPDDLDLLSRRMADLAAAFE